MNRFGLLTIWAIAVLAACGGGVSTASRSPAVLGPPSNDQLVSAGTLSIGSDISRAPMESFKPGALAPEGFDIDLGTAIASKLGLKVVWINEPLDGIVPALTSRKLDFVLSAMKISNGLKSTVDLLPYFRAGESFVLERRSTRLCEGCGNLSSVADLCGLRVAVESASAEESAVNAANDASTKGPCVSKKIIVRSFQTESEALNQLAQDAADVFFVDSAVAGYEVSRDLNLTSPNSLVNATLEGIAFRKNDAAIEGPITQAFQAVEAEGTYGALLTKWGLQDGDIRKAVAS